MNTEQYQAVKELFLALRDLAPVERAARLDRVGGADDALRTEVAALLAEHDSAGVAPGILAASHRLPTQIGRYTIRGVLGVGGMGVVYEAEQENPRRTVALKVIRPGRTLPDVLRRFEHEAQFLGRLQHPGIAHIYEAGTADDGFGLQPFFAMELVRGEPITQFAKRRELDTRCRLRLFVTVCDAVEHAHRRGIVHRDLKPGNILVGDDGQSKILDFGVARAIDSDVAATTAQTDVGQLIGTIPYMSPEQVMGSSADLDLRSDVYSLGVVCYELVAERLPYSLSDLAIPEALRVIREQDAAPLTSTSRAFRGDLNTILAKALEKDRDRRYVSAAELAEDIRHFLASEPIRARPASAIYQLQRFTSRHRLAAVLVGAIGLMTMAYAVIASVQAIRLRDERNLVSAALDRESLARKDAEEVVTFLESLFTQGDPNEAATTQPTVRDLLDAGAARLKGELKDHASRPRLLTALGRVYVSLEHADVACDLLKEAETLQVSQFGAQSAEHAAALIELGHAYANNGDSERGDALLTQGCDLSLQLFGEDDERTADALENRGFARFYSGAAEAALGDFQRSLAIRRKLFVSPHRSVADALSNIAMAYNLLKRPQDADKCERESLAIRRELHDDRGTAFSLDNLSQIAFALGDLKAAEASLAEEVEISRRIYHPNHPRLAWALNNYAFLVKSNSGPEASVPIYREALAIRRKAYGDDHVVVAQSCSDLGNMLSAIGQHEEAVEQLKRAVAIRRAKLGQRHDFVGRTLYNLAQACRHADDLAQAELFLLESLSIGEESHSDAAHLQNVRQSLVWVYESLHHDDDAERLRMTLQAAKSSTLTTP